jgi:hypothetical protein
VWLVLHEADRISQPPSGHRPLTPHGSMAAAGHAPRWGARRIRPETHALRRNSPALSPLRSIWLLRTLSAARDSLTYLLFFAGTSRRRQREAQNSFIFLSLAARNSAALSFSFWLVPNRGLTEIASLGAWTRADLHCGCVTHRAIIDKATSARRMRQAGGAPNLSGCGRGCRVCQATSGTDPLAPSLLLPAPCSLLPAPCSLRSLRINRANEPPKTPGCALISARNRPYSERIRRPSRRQAR